MENVKGFKNLTQEQQELLIELNARHKAGVGTDYKDGFTPIAVASAGKNLRVVFKNGEHLFYTPEGSWY